MFIMHNVAALWIHLLIEYAALSLLLFVNNVRAQVEYCDVPDINECTSAPCTNGAACTDSLNDTSIPHNSYRCTCLAGFGNGTCAEPPEWLPTTLLGGAGLCDVGNGGNCDIDLDECLSSPCAAGEACFDSSTDPTLQPDEYYCEAAEMDSCHSSPCFNGGTCSSAAVVADGHRQWLLQCTEGVPTVNFTGSEQHEEVVIYDGDSDDAPVLLSCGGYCDANMGGACNGSKGIPCTSARGTGSRVIVGFELSVSSSSVVVDPTAWVYASFLCEAVPTLGPGSVNGGRRSLQDRAAPPPVRDLFFVCLWIGLSVILSVCICTSLPLCLCVYRSVSLPIAVSL
jgi:hypothetical protein